MLSKLLFIIPFNIVRQDSKGRYSHNVPKNFPNTSLGKYIPLVKHTSWTIMLEMPDDAFSEDMLPIIIPIPMNKVAITIDTNIAHIMLKLKSSPRKIAKMKNNMFWMRMIGIIESIYPNIYSDGFMGLIPNLISNDVVLSLLISIAVKSVIKEKPKITIPGVKFSSA